MSEVTGLGGHRSADPVAATRAPLSPDADVCLLWTGGWDSTFRMLQLMAETSAVVQPVYVIDPHRTSVLHELRAMIAIRHSIGERIPGAAARLLPTRLHLVNEISGEAEVSAAIAALRRVAHLGGQYDWLARLARDLGTGDLELTIHRDDRAYTFIQDALIEFDDALSGSYHRVADTRPELEAFRRFRFPILGWTKVRMRDWARDHGLEDILDQTWFCHTPVRGRPCGTCNPCQYAVAEGIGYRLTWRGRLRHHLHVLLHGPRPTVRPEPRPGIFGHHRGHRPDATN